MSCYRSTGPFGHEHFNLRFCWLNEEKVMQANVGSTDRVIRILIGLGLITATLLGSIGAWGWIGVVPLATGLFRFCPAYLPFGISTCRAKQ